jgi:hypothetical protein
MTRTVLVAASLSTLMAFRAQAEDADRVLDESVAECLRTNDGVCLERMAAFEEAAVAHEAASGAEPALLRLARLRLALGQGLKADAASQELVVRFPKSPHLEEAAAIALSLGDDLRDDTAKAALHYESYLRVLGGRGGWDRYVVAQVRLAALLMRASCPVRGYFESCVEVVRIRTECPRPQSVGGMEVDPWTGVRLSRPLARERFYWGEVARRHARDPRKVRQAEQHLDLALGPSTLRKAERDARGDVDRERSLANARGEALRLAATDEWDAYLALGAPPYDLELALPTQHDDACETRRKQRVYESSTRRFARWMELKTRGAESLRDQYKVAIAEGGPESAVVAAAHIAMVLDRFADGLWTMHDPECRTDPSGCGFYNNRTDAIEEREVAAAGQCDVLANMFAIHDDFAAFCRHQLEMLKPGEFPHGNEAFLTYSRDEEDRAPWQIAKVDSPPRRLPEHSPRPCRAGRPRPEPEERGRAHLATIYGSNDWAEWQPFTDGFLASMEQRFGSPWPVSK